MDPVSRGGSVSLVMPCYNEEEIIEEVVRSYHREVIAKIADSEFIVVDDCSRDGTGKIVDRLAKELPRLRVLRPPANRGHGGAVLLGYEAALKEFTFQSDSDNQFYPEEFWKLHALRDEADFIVGRRVKRHDAGHRLILSKIVRGALRLLFGVTIADANCPFRLIRTSTLKRLLPMVEPEANAPNIMLSILAERCGARVREVEITHRPRKTGKVWIVKWGLIKFAWGGFTQLLRLRARLPRKVR